MKIVMPYETETKVLNIDKADLLAKLEKIGAKKILETRLTVDWFQFPGTKSEAEPWYLRVRKYSDGKVEITWKGQSQTLGKSRTHEEINLNVSDFEKAKDFLVAIGLVNYAHQEKDRSSWTLKHWRFDLDQYPGIPAYLEIEGRDEAHIGEALKFLGLEDKKIWSGGERVLIQKEYGLDWYEMRFSG